MLMNVAPHGHTLLMYEDDYLRVEIISLHLCSPRTYIHLPFGIFYWPLLLILVEIYLQACNC
jgi:hypothetical protein